MQHLGKGLDGEADLPEHNRRAFLVKEAGDRSRIADAKAVRPALEDLVDRRREAVGVDGGHKTPDLGPDGEEEALPRPRGGDRPGPARLRILLLLLLLGRLGYLELGLSYDEHTSDLDDGGVVTRVVVRRNLAAVVADAYYG